MEVEANNDLGAVKLDVLGREGLLVHHNVELV